MNLLLTRCRTPIGTTLAWRTERGLVAVGFHEDRRRLTRVLAGRFGEIREAPDEGVAIRDRIAAYFEGDVSRLQEAPVDIGGTPLQRRIWLAVRDVPPGCTLSYGELATRVGTGARVIGNAMARNPLGLVVPCHRVVAGDGSLGGYASGMARKRWLIVHERKHAQRPRKRRM